MGRPRRQWLSRKHLSQRLMNLPDFVIREIGIERNRKCRPVRFLAIGETELIQIAVDRSKDGLATVNPLLLQYVDETRQTIRNCPEMRESNGKSIVSMRPAGRHARTDDGFGGQDFSKGCREKAAPLLKSLEPTQLGDAQRCLQVRQ